MAQRVCPEQTQQLPHFLSTSSWLTAPLERLLRKAADALVGGKDAVLIVDATVLPKQGRHSVGVKRQHCGVLGKQANCQVLVSLTLGKKKCQSRLLFSSMVYTCPLKSWWTGCFLDFMHHFKMGSPGAYSQTSGRGGQL
jgi:SRSO17 transposase